MPNTQYFLGGNTPSGFYSLYHQLSDPARMRALYIIKGGPGSGKSTLMRRVERHVQAAGLETVQVLCSGDPDSLDAVMIPGLGAALVDGTAPQGVVSKGHFEDKLFEINGVTAHPSGLEARRKKALKMKAAVPLQGRLRGR